MAFVPTGTGAYPQAALKASAGAVSAPFAILYPPSGPAALLVQNRGTVDVLVAWGADSSVAASVAGAASPGGGNEAVGQMVYAGSERLFGIPAGVKFVALMALGAAGDTSEVWISVGSGE